MIETRTRRLFAALIVIGALTAAGCGSSSKSNSSNVSASSYVSSVCSAATTWKNAIQSAGTALQAQASTKSLAKTKAAYVSFVSALASATSNAESQLASAGSPSVTGGQKVASTLVGIFASAKKSLMTAETDAQAIPTTGTKTFQTAAAKVQNDVRDSLAAMSAVAPEKNPALHAAAAKDPTCKSLAAAG